MSVRKSITYKQEASERRINFPKLIHQSLSKPGLNPRPLDFQPGAHAPKSFWFPCDIS